MTAGIAGLLARLHRHEWGRAVASLARAFGDPGLAEEMVQEAYAAALARWPEEGVPDRPAAWLHTVARNRAVDRLRRDRRYAERLAELERAASSTVAEVPSDKELLDDELAMLCACCHPALAMPARVALTLRLVAGLGTAEIARAFLVPEPTMAQRLVRAKRKLRDAGIPIEVPPPERLGARLDGVLAVLYLTFNAGYSSPAAPPAGSADVAREAIRLARLLLRLVPREPEAAGLLALMLLQHARRAARTDATGRLVLLEDQDRSRWDRRAIAEGVALVDQALRHGAGPYRLQAAVAAVHATAATAAGTDWERILALYTELLAVQPSPVVALNRAVAVAMVHGPQAGLAAVDDLAADGRLDGYHLLHAARADLLRRLGRRREAARSYARALGTTTDEAERRFLKERLAEVEERTGRARTRGRGRWGAGYDRVTNPREPLGGCACREDDP
ncbi:sigma-70 family RNA polymerase sigma factor [soil metagenome]